MVIDFKGKMWSLMPMNAGQTIAHATAMRDLAYGDLKKSLVGLPLALCKELFVARASEIRKIQHATNEHRATMFSFAGMSHAIYLGLLGAGAEVSPADADELLEGTPKLAYVAMELLRVPVASKPATSTEPSTPQTAAAAEPRE